ncbi:c-type cytochrome biogenesis protein CcmI [Rhizobium sp. C1]|uniref:c-type cytochrome biogenesis protein CcmI n=1 Tax=Rhizobium sp. C1 TaxID=1349799 RepID=UPI001E346C46|nr:c-type cytochrome biogenesis protein CcmI [Rhizobium sp. C1]MCD2177502.1 c-type cytochrome biogenesis protein CcmI [Rhizobium sp. C1]
MLFWILVSCLTALLAVALLAPLLRRPATAGGEHSHDVEVYRDQMAEVDRDAAAGLISSEEADYARAEIGRRLLSSADKASKETDGAQAAQRRSRHPLAQAFIILILPAIGIGLYLLTGNPGAPDAPLAARLANPGNDVSLLLAKAENHLIQNPDDGAGWDLVAPIYLRNRRPGDAANAYRQAIRIRGESVERLGGLGEAIVMSNQGLVNSEATDAFRKALSLDRNDARSEFYLAYALEQEGRSMEALAAFQALAKSSAPDAPWQPLVAQHIANLQKGTSEAKPGQGPANPDAPGNPTAADIAAAQDMSAGDRQQMIQNMVAGLSEKLKANPNNFEGWMRLVRSYAMLKQADKAGEALESALKTFPADSQQGKQLVALAAQFGIKAPEAKP